MFRYKGEASLRLKTLIRIQRIHSAPHLPSNSFHMLQRCKRGRAGGEKAGGEDGKVKRLGEGEEDKGRGLYQVAVAGNLRVEPAQAGPAGFRGSGEPWVK